MCEWCEGKPWSHEDLERVGHPRFDQADLDFIATLSRSSLRGWRRALTERRRHGE